MTDKERKKRMRDVQDVLSLISGRWRGPILALLCHQPRRFSQLKLELGIITSATLTKELRFLELNKMVKAEKSTITGNSVVYAVTSHGSSMEPLIDEIHKWAQKHRKVVLNNLAE